MADLISMIADIDGMRDYEANRNKMLGNEAQAMKNQEQRKILDLKYQLEQMQNNPYGKYNVWDPQGRRQQLMSDEEQLGIASRWANSIKNLAPEKREQGYQQFLQAMPTLGIDVSDMPQGYDEGYIEQLAGYGIDPNTQYANEMALERQKLADEQAMRRMYAQDALSQQRKQAELDRQNQMIEQALQNGDITPEQARQARLSQLGLKTLAPDTKGEADLRKEFNALTADYRKVGDSYSRIRAAIKNPSPAGDLSLIFNYMKMLDPGSVVRESEFKNAENAKAWFDSAGVPTSVRLAYNQASTGQKLLPEQRADFVNMAENLMGAQRVGFNRYADTYRNIARSSGLDADRIVIDPYNELVQEPSAQTQPQPQLQDGTVIENDKGEKMILRGGQWQKM